MLTPSSTTATRTPLPVYPVSQADSTSIETLVSFYKEIAPYKHCMLFFNSVASATEVKTIISPSFLQSPASFCVLFTVLATSSNLCLLEQFLNKIYV